MKKFVNKFVSLVVATMMICGLMVNASAVDVPDYAHLEMGSITAVSLEAGDTVRIPVSLVGLQDGESFDSMAATLTAQDYLEINGIEKVGTVADWDGGWSETAGVGLMGWQGTNSYPITSDCKLFDIVCTVTEDIPAGTTTGVKITNIDLRDYPDYLNVDETGALDTNAIVYPTDEDGTTSYGVIVPEIDTYLVEVTATESEVVLDETFDVEITVYGGEFTGAQYTLTYDTALFERTSALEGYAEEDTAGTITDLYAVYNTPAETVIASYTFKALAQDAQVTGEFTLTEAKAASNTSALEGDAPLATVSNPAEVTIMLSDDLIVTAPDVTATYDGSPVGATVTAEPSTATIRYMDEDGNYTLTESPTFTAVGEYEVKYQVTLKGYETVTGTVVITIEAPDFMFETIEYVPGWSLVLVYSDYEASSYLYNGVAMFDVSAAKYQYNGESYAKVFGLVVAGDAYQDSVSYTSTAAEVVTYSTDINNSGTTEINDVVNTIAVYNGDAAYMTDAQMVKVLRSDVNCSKYVDSDDTQAVIAVMQ